MTGMKDLLVHVADDAVSPNAVDLAGRLAGEFGARLRLLLPLPPAGAGVLLSAEAAALAQQSEHARRTALRALGERLSVAVQPRVADAVDWRVVDGDVLEVLVANARHADLLVVAQRGPAGAGGLSPGQAARLIVGAGCPVLIVPHIGWAPESLHGRVFERALVAWADTRESSRALRDALPLLARASRVEMVTFAGGTDDAARAGRASLGAAAAWLSRHGIRAETHVLTQREPSIGERMQRGWVTDVAAAEALLSQAADSQADFIVMGGYGRPRVLEFALGGVTRTMLEAMTVPLLMSH